MTNIYFHQDKDFDKETKILNKQTNELFKFLINVCNSYNIKKYEELAKFLVRRITIWKPTPYFEINIEDIPYEIKKNLVKLTDSELDILMNSVIDKIFHYSLWNEKYFDYKYFLEEIQQRGLLKWRLI